MDNQTSAVDFPNPAPTPELTNQEKIDYIFSVAQKLEALVESLAPMAGMFGGMMGAGPGADGFGAPNLMGMLQQ